jgi:hypothetical protein
MEKKALKRKCRCKLFAAKAARDEEIRRQIQAEFPPLEGDSSGVVLRDQGSTAGGAAILARLESRPVRSGGRQSELA